MLTHMVVYRSAAGRSEPNVDVFAEIVCRIQERLRRFNAWRGHPNS